jgi:hypothetical protein
VLIDFQTPNPHRAVLDEIRRTHKAGVGFADFVTVRLACNRNTVAAPNWLAIGGANTEIRWSDVSTGLLTTASAAWPAMIRPAATQNVAYTYMYDADATGTGFISTSTGSGGTGANPIAFANTSYLWARWDWDAVGTFASAPVFTAYDDTNHNSPSARGGTANNILSGNATDTGATARSYLKANAFGRGVLAGAPAAAPANAPVVTDGATGSLAPTAGANWLTNYQGLMADLDFITAPFTPAATTADQWNVIFALFTGPNMGPKVYTAQLTLKYTWT